jgi:methionyl-tRNA formyltransferase
LKKIYFFGGGKLLTQIIQELNKKIYYKKFEQVVILSKRHAKEKVYKKLSFKNFLTKNKIKFLVCENLNKSLAQKIDNNSVGFSFGSAWIFKKKFIKKFNGRFFNIHASNLPEGRGGGGFSWQILMDYKTLTICIHRLEPGIDKGEIIFKNDFKLLDNSLPLDIQKIYEREAKKIFMKKLKFLVNLNLKGKKQDENKSIYWPRMNLKIHGWINWNWTANEIFRFIKSFDDPYDGAQTKLNNQTVYLKKCNIVKSKKNFHPFQNGLIFRKNKNLICVSCKDSILAFKKILNKDKKNIPLSKIKIGDRFYTPLKVLEKALSTRVFYDSSGKAKKV